MKRKDRSATAPVEYVMGLNREIITLQSRATGRTTRLVDEVIQQLYRNPGKWIALFDHYYDGKHEHHLYDMVMRRMSSEHPNDVVERRQGHISAIEIRLAYCPAREYFEREEQRLRELIDEARNKTMKEIEEVRFRLPLFKFFK